MLGRISQEECLHAASMNDMNTVFKFIAQKESPAAINAVDLYGWTALMFAAHYGGIFVIKGLLAAGADVNATDPSGYTPLMRAAGRSDNIFAVEVLLEAPGINLTAQNHEHYTAAMIAEPYRDKTIYHLIIDAMRKATLAPSAAAETAVPIADVPSINVYNAHSNGVFVSNGAISNSQAEVVAPITGIPITSSYADFSYDHFSLFQQPRHVDIRTDKYGVIIFDKMDSPESGQPHIGQKPS